MAYLSGGDTLPDDQTRPALRAAGSRPWDRRPAVPATAADNGVFWTPEVVDDVQYPTRMARRRAQEAAQILDGWQPDPVLTPPMLARVGDELLRLFHEPLDPELESPASADASRAQVHDARPAPAGPRGHGRRARAGSSRHRSRWSRRGRKAAAIEPPGVRDSDPVAVPHVVRQDDPVDDAAWFAGLKEMTLADERADQRAATHESPPTWVDEPEVLDGTPAGVEHDVVAPPPVDVPNDEVAPAPVEAQPDVVVAPPADVPQEVVARPQADGVQIVPASVPTSGSVVRRWVAIGVAAAVVLAAGVAVALNRGGPDGRTTPATSVASQEAIVVAFSLTEQAAQAVRGPAAPTKKKGSKVDPVTAVQAQAGDVTGLSLLAVGGGSAQHVLVPSRLLLDVPGAGRVPMARSLAGSPDAPGEAITDALEVTVDATWTLDSAALAALVDRVGGVVVDVDADVTKGTQVGAAVLVAAGPQQKLAGAQAALFAQFLGADEPEAARLARQEHVLRAVLSALPDDPATIRTVVGDLPGAPDGAALDAVARVVSASRLAAVSNELASTVLPTKEIDAGGAVVAYGLDDKATAQLVDARLAGARLPVAAVGHVRVLVQNGVGAPGLGDSARGRLLAAGLRYVAGGNLPGFGQKQTVVLLRDASSASRARGMAVASALGLGESSLRISETAPTIADVVVILGQDYARS